MENTISKPPEDHKEIEDVQVATREYIKTHYFFRFFLTLFACILGVIVLIYDAIHFSNPFAIPFIFIPILIMGFFYGYIQRKIEEEFFEQFAAENNYTYREKIPSISDIDSVVLQNMGHDQHLQDIIEGTYETFPIKIYTYITTLGYGKESHDVEFTVAEMQYTGDVLDIVISSKLFNREEFSFTSSGVKQLSLEGDFNKYFNVYIPKDYEIETLEILTPDIMQELIEQSKHFNIEFNKNKLFVFASRVITKRSDLDELFNFSKMIIRELAPVLSRIKENMS